MDCLTGYGSDSDESSSSAAAGGDNQVSKAAPLSNLLGAGIDSCSSSDEEDTPKEHKPSHASSSSSKRILNNNTGIDGHVTKKQRIEAFPAKNGLPSPQIAQSDAAEKASMVSWREDFISKEQPKSSTVSKSDTDCKFEKFEKLAASQSYDVTKGLAAHLRNQNEFHNPHYLQSVIEQFGIAESLGSRAASRKMIKQSKFQ